MICYISSSVENLVNILGDFAAKINGGKKIAAAGIRHRYEFAYRSDILNHKKIIFMIEYITSII